MVKLPKHIKNKSIYGKKQQLILPIASLVEEYKAGKIRAIMILRYSKDNEITENPPEV